MLLIFFKVCILIIIRKYTWRRFNGTQRSRLDYFVVSEQLGCDKQQQIVTTADFLKFHFKVVGMFLLRSVNCGFEKGKMSITQKQGVSERR